MLEAIILILKIQSYIWKIHSSHVESNRNASRNSQFVCFTKLFVMTYSAVVKRQAALVLHGDFCESYIPK